MTLRSFLLRWGLDKEVKSAMDWETLDKPEICSFPDFIQSSPKKSLQDTVAAPTGKEANVLSFPSRPPPSVDSPLLGSPFTRCSPSPSAPKPSLGCPNLLFLFRVGNFNDPHDVSYSKMVLSSTSTKCPPLGYSGLLDFNVTEAVHIRA